MCKIRYLIEKKEKKRKKKRASLIYFYRYLPRIIYSRFFFSLFKNRASKTPPFVHRDYKLVNYLATSRSARLYIYYILLESIALLLLLLLLPSPLRCCYVTAYIYIYYIYSILHIRQLLSLDLAVFRYTRLLRIRTTAL